MRAHICLTLIALLLATFILPLSANGVGGPVDWAAVQWPFSTTTIVGVATADIYGRVYHPGITDSPGQGLDMDAELGFGADGTDPWSHPSWTWVPAVYNGDLGAQTSDDEYVATVTPQAPGVYDYAYRFTIDVGTTWVYADLRDPAHPTPPGGSADGYDYATAGDLVVLEDGLCPKWIQPPDCEYGVDLPSYALTPEPGGEPVSRFIVGDDWLCDGRPITAIRWWGSYPGWASDIPPDAPPDGRPIGFRLSWYTDIPQGDPQAPEYSRPGHLLTNVFVSLLPYMVAAQAAGDVTEFYECPVPKMVEPGIEHEYEYFVELPEPWNEKRGRVYWLTIEAIFAPGYVPGEQGPGELFPEWGWKTSTETDIIDDAVVWLEVEAPVGFAGAGWFEMIWPVYPWMPGLFYPPLATTLNYQELVNAENQGPSLNMAFELLTDICPRRTEKWEQPPDMVTGTDMWSWTDLEDAHRSPFLRADDFISDGRRITDIHWWGSYSNWMVEVEGSETNPIAPPGINMFMRPVGFNLSWHTNDASQCLPGAELTNIFVGIEFCHEMFYGDVFQAWEEPPIYEHEYQYYVDLLAVAEPWYEKAGGHYWLNIEAVFDPQFVPDTQGEGGHGGWGWKISEIPPQEGMDCPAAVYHRAGGVWIHDPIGLQPPHPKAGQFYNLAFELTTDEISTHSPTLPIVITNLVVTSGMPPARVIKSVGTSGTGTQYLQLSTNLLTNVWTDIPGQVKVSPFPPPITNTWTVIGATESNAFYRIMEK
ncbi:MAG: hypothetical protein HN919_08095 [Verrucomicrobia bacterium]|jgi:hypothetical protein|nr:hypothetical protein [Verrucomicrobiota bacterium]MBT7066247.1 hypothetical protein [Verrucomicrobiota bacterium]MBT7699020.1 hypothetical protein [Verrucomicrobiota bacterium]